LSHYINIPPASGEQRVEPYATYAAFPVTGEIGIVYIDEDASDLYLWDGAVYVLQAGSVGATTALDNLASTAVNASIIPATNGSIDLGASAKRWLTGYFQSLRTTSIQGNSSQIAFSNNTSGGDFNFYGNINLFSDSSGNALKLWNDDEADYVGFSVDPALGGTTDYVLPNADGSTGQFLQTDGSGILSWQSPSTAWGGITGTLSDQTDLQTALNEKEMIYDWALNLDRQAAFWTDFCQNDRATLNIAANAGGGTGQVNSNDSVTGVNSTENCLGVFEMVLGSGTTARAMIYNSGTIMAGTNQLRCGFRSALTSGLSDGTNTYTAYIGFLDNPNSGDMTDGIYFRYTHSVNGGRWEAVVADAGVRAAVDTGIAPSNTVNQVFVIIVNQAGTQAQFYIDGTLTNTVSSGLPGAGDFFFYGAKIEKSAGTTSRSIAVDWLYFNSLRTSAR